MASVLSRFSLVLCAVSALGSVACDGGSDEESTGGTGGTSAAGGTGGSAGTSTGGEGVELLTAEALAAGWIGGDPAVADDDPAGIQGAVYLYGDNTSCTFTMGDNPCTPEAGCCLSGTTVVDPTFAAWGCGIGISLNDTGGDASMKQPYKGTATGFKYEITGSAGAQLRVGVTQFADTEGLVSPYYPIGTFTDGAQGTVTFDDITYPSWCATNEDCLAPPDMTQAAANMPSNPMYAHDLQFQIAGGESASEFNFCIKSLQAVQ